MPKLIDLKGKRFGRLQVICRDNTVSNHRAVYWVCKCDCGKIKSVTGNSLKNGGTKSCGCLRRDNLYNKRHTKYTDIHNNNARLFNIWHSMHDRCYSEKFKQYHNYGGRGIKVCEEWHGDDGFVNFVKWAKENGYSGHLTIDRINVNDDYYPENCRWVTHKKQQNNRTNNRYITYNGETRTLSEWCELYGYKFTTLTNRLDKLGLPFEIAITMDGLTKVEYNGKKTSIRRIAQIEHINYKKLLHAILVDGEDVEVAVSHLKSSGCLTR